MDNTFKHLLIQGEQSIKEGLSIMDKVGYKLLIVIDDTGRFLNLLTIGDVQRAIIANKSLHSSISSILEDKMIIVARDNDTREWIKEQMLHYRLAYMPVLDNRNNILKIIYWEDIIEDKSPVFENLNLPVVIMAGGFGSRLKPLTNVLPKPLLPYGNQTILENIIDRFKRYNCHQFDISVNYKAELIQFYFDSMTDKDYTIDFFTEDKPLGTAGSLHLLKEKLNNTFFVSNCDILIDEDYAAIYNYHQSNKNELTIVASVKSYDIPYGTIETGEDGMLVSLKEKPQLDYLINCGMYILEPHLLNEIPENIFFHITDLIEKVKLRSGRIGVFPISDKSWIDIGEWQFYSRILFGN